jgi:hypothetical protein
MFSEATLNAPVIREAGDGERELLMMNGGFVLLQRLA